MQETSKHTYRWTDKQMFIATNWAKATTLFVQKLTRLKLTVVKLMNKQYKKLRLV